MTTAVPVAEATQANFPQLVLANSHKGPVLAVFCSQHAGPCRILWPRLVELTRRLQHRFLLVRVDMDGQPELAREQGINSVPTSRLYVDGEVVETIHGAASDDTFIRLLERFLPRDSDRYHAEAIRAYRAGRTEQALVILAQAAMEDPENPRLPLDLAKMLVLDGRPRAAADLLATLPDGLRANADIQALRTHLDILVAAEEVTDLAGQAREVEANPDDLAARHRLAAALLVRDNYADALEQLWQMHQRDPGYKDHLARRAMLSVFTLLGPQHELVIRYRTRMLDGR